MSQAVLTSKATIVPQISIPSLSISKMSSETEKRKREIFYNIINDNIGDAITNLSKPPPYYFIPYSDGDLDPPSLYEVDENPVHLDGIAVFEQTITDYWIHAELNLPQGEEMKKVKVVG